MAEVREIEDNNAVEVAEHPCNWQEVDDTVAHDLSEFQTIQPSLAPIGNVKPARQSHPPWTSAEDEDLRQMNASGATFAKIRAHFKSWTFDVVLEKWQKSQRRTTLDRNDPEIREMLSSDRIEFGDRKEATDRYLNGHWQTLIWESGGRGVLKPCVQLYGLRVHFPPDFQVHPEAKKVRVKVQFGADDTTSPHCVVDASCCIDEDPARRLEVLISAYSEDGRKVACWGEAGNLYARANTLADYLLGLEFETIKHTSRRGMWGGISRAR